MSATVQTTAKPDAPATHGHERLFQIAPPEELLYSLSADGRRKFMHPVVRKGQYWEIRRGIGYALIGLFFALPLISVGGHPAMQLDITTWKLHFFGGTFHPTDNLLLAALGFGVVVTVFFVGSTFGRVWCGFGCPQTVYFEFLFRPLESWIEGGPTNQRHLNKAPWSAHKVRVKATKWLVFAAIAVAMATTFVAYFLGWPTLAPALLHEPLKWTGALFTIGFVTTLIVFDFGWFRDQMCTIACPYGRLQNVLSDKDTLLVAYDTTRGEPRTRAKDLAPGMGACIDCGACVSACPTGVDIRRGFQVECIGTAQCIDACDEVMRKLGRPTGLIKFTSEREQQGGRRHLWRTRNLIYLGLMTIAWGVFGTLVFTRADALVEVVRGGREPYRLLNSGEVANQQRIRFTNQRDEQQRFTVEVLAPKDAELVLSQSPVDVAKEQVVTVNAVITVPRSLFTEGQATVRYLVTSDKGFRKEISFLLLGPFGPRKDGAMRIVRLISDYRWPIIVGGHLTMSVVACGILVYVATRPDVPRPIEGYYESARSWDADEAVVEASRDLGWTVRYELPAGVPHVPGAPRPVDVTVVDRQGQPVSNLSGQLLAVRPSDARLNQRGTLVALPTQAGAYRTLVRIDEPGTWELRLDTTQASMRFVHAARLTVAADDAMAPEAAAR